MMTCRLVWHSPIEQIKKDENWFLLMRKTRRKCSLVGRQWNETTVANLFVEETIINSKTTKNYLFVMKTFQFLWDENKKRTAQRKRRTKTRKYWKKWMNREWNDNFNLCCFAREKKKIIEFDRKFSYQWSVEHGWQSKSIVITENEFFGFVIFIFIECVRPSETDFTGFARKILVNKKQWKCISKIVFISSPTKIAFLSSRRVRKRLHHSMFVTSTAMQGHVFMFR